MKLFTIYNKPNTFINMEWQIMKGGYVHIGKMSWVFLHRFFVIGNPGLGNEKEFIFRMELAMDTEPKFSLFTLEAVNLYEARWLYAWFKLWKNYTIRFVFNLGFRLTRNSRDFIHRQALIEERRIVDKLKIIGGRKNGTIAR